MNSDNLKALQVRMDILRSRIDRQKSQEYKFMIDDVKVDPYVLEDILELAEAQLRQIMA